MKFYQGKRFQNDLSVCVNGRRDLPLTHVEYHSPDGFEWGYPGSGPADLALAILTDFFSEDPIAVQTYARTGQGEPSAAVHAHQRFKDKFISVLPKDHWRLREDEIKKWYYEVIGALCKECKCGMKESDGCRLFGIPMKDGSTGDPIKHGEETRSDWGRDGKRCHDCGAKPGHYHHPGCDVEECPGCGGQLIGCACLLEDKDETEEGVG